MAMDSRILLLTLLMSFRMQLCVPVVPVENNEPQPDENANKGSVDIIMEVNTKENVAKDLYEGDIRWPREIGDTLKSTKNADEISLPQRGNERRSRGPEKRGTVANPSSKWPVVGAVHEVPFVIKPSSINQKQTIYNAMNHWTSNVPCIKFVPRTNQKDYISFYRGRGCNADIGRIGGEQTISIGKGCGSMGVIAHEIGHILGFDHEQARPDRDLYVKILWQNIRPGLGFAFKKKTNIDSLGMPYDYNSLMHYGHTAFNIEDSGLSTITKLDGSTDLGNANSLSANDIEQAKLMYCRPRTSACKDKVTYCEGYKNYCTSDSINWQTSMKKNCEKTCNLCPNRKK